MYTYSKFSQGCGMDRFGLWANGQAIGCATDISGTPF